VAAAAGPAFLCRADLGSDRSWFRTDPVGAVSECVASRRLGLPVVKSRLDLRIVQGRESAAVELLAREGDAEVVVRR
jgi:hypothetical protein